MPRFVRRLLRFGACAFLAGGAALSARGYALEGYSWPGPTIPMRVQLGGSSIPLADGSVDFNASAVNALRLWNQQIAPTQFTWTVVPTGTAASEGDGVNSMQFSSTIYGDSFGKGTLAVTVIDSSGGTIIESDILFNTANKLNSYRGSTTDAGTQGFFDLHRIALHELGHVLGLDHPDEAGQKVTAIMNSTVSLVDSLQADDIAGAVFLYGAPADPPPPTGQSQILQISTRGRVETGDNVMIGGFIIQTETTKKIIVRAIGPSLGSSGVVGALPNPNLELYDSAGDLVQTNEDWRDSQEEEIIASGVPPKNNLESAIVAELGPGGYTAIVRGKGSSTGVALVEVYDLEPDDGTIANISTRARIGTGDDVLIGGIILQAPQAQPLVIRALGPSLGVPGSLTNPKLDVYNGNGDLVVSNDNYPNAVNAAVIGSYGLYPKVTLESAVYLEAAPGSYTAIVSGIGGTSGVGLIEVYGVQ